MTNSFRGGWGRLESRRLWWRGVRNWRVCTGSWSENDIHLFVSCSWSAMRPPPSPGGSPPTSPSTGEDTPPTPLPTPASLSPSLPSLPRTTSRGVGAKTTVSALKDTGNLQTRTGRTGRTGQRGQRGLIGSRGSRGRVLSIKRGSSLSGGTERIGIGRPGIIDLLTWIEVLGREESRPSEPLAGGGSLGANQNCAKVSLNYNIIQIKISKIIKAKEEY